MVTRVITAFVGIAVAITILFFSATPVFNLAVSVLTVIILYELLKACGCLKYKFHSVVCFVFAAIMPFMTQYTGMELRYVLSSACILMVFAGYIAKHSKITFEQICCMLSVTLLTTLSMCCIVSLKNLDEVHGVCYVIICLAGAWLGDSGAYFAGTFLGKKFPKKLCPEISPKKTVVGAIGGVLTVGLVFAAYGFGYRLVQGYRGIEFGVNYPYLVIMGLICGVLGIVGDLSASLIKRQYGIKDYGNIMPGHGGMTDRFDSVLFVAPFMMMAISRFTLFK